jgi:hypothetical protein
MEDERDRELAAIVANVPGAIYRCALDPDWTMAVIRWTAPSGRPRPRIGRSQAPGHRRRRARSRFTTIASLMAGYMLGMVWTRDLAILEGFHASPTMSLDSVVIGRGER